MEKERLIRCLNSVGKECFVKYFELFFNQNKSNQEIADIIEAENGYTRKLCNSRTGHARIIIREGGIKDALKLIISSDRLDHNVIAKAKRLLSGICG